MIASISVRSKAFEPVLGRPSERPEARETARALAREEGIFGGFSAGANVAAALRLLAGPEAGRLFRRRIGPVGSFRSQSLLHLRAGGTDCRGT